MSDNDHRLYWYEEYRDLVITRDSIYVNNTPMNNRNIKAHRGLTNTLLFNIRDRDRKLQNMDAYILRATMVDPNTSTRIFTKPLDSTLDIGKVKLVLSEGDLANVDPGRYWIYITRQTSDNHQLPLYKDQDNNVRFDIEITDQAGVVPLETQTTTTINQTSSTTQGDSANVFVSEPLNGNICRNFQNAQHTMAIYLNGYDGDIQIQGSCLNNVPNTTEESTDWFDLKNITITDTSQIVAVTNFSVNCNWLRIISTPNQGSVEKITVRN